MYTRVSYKAAEAESDKIGQALGESDLRVEVDPHAPGVPPWLFDYFIKCQKLTDMDYRAYARRLWSELIDPEGKADQVLFKEFERDLIQGLRGIDMRPMVYPDILEHLPQLVSILRRLILKTVLWSAGDVHSTGYQTEKIRRSGLIQKIRHALKDLLGRNEAGYFKYFTEYMVGENKTALLREHLAVLKAGGLEVTRLVVVDDSLKNLQAAAAAVDEIFGKKSKVIPVWAMYSRKGLQAVARARGLASFRDVSPDTVTQEELQKVAGPGLVALRSFSDLMVRDDIKSALQSSELVLDFDGVLVDNVKTRNAQSQVQAAALQKAVQRRHGLAPEAAETYLEERIKQTAEGSAAGS